MHFDDKQPVITHHGLRGDWLSMGDGNFRPPQNPHPLTGHQKISTGDYVGGPCGCAKFGANPSTGASGQMGKK